MQATVSITYAGPVIHFDGLENEIRVKSDGILGHYPYPEYRGEFEYLNKVIWTLLGFAEPAAPNAILLTLLYLCDMRKERMP